MPDPLTSQQVLEVNHLVKRALFFIGIRSRSRQEVEIYLKRKLSPPDPTIIDAVLAKIDHFNLLNDADFAHEYAQYLLNRGKGPMLISLLLKTKGIAPPLIRQTVEGLDPAAVQAAAAKQLKKHLSGTPKLKGFALKAKATHYLFTRGFPASMVERVIDESLPDTVK